MAERPSSKPEIASQKRTIKLPPSIGDWTAYRPPKVLVKRVKTGLYGFDRLSKEELNLVLLIHYRFIEKLLERLKLDLGLGVEFFSCQAEQTTYLNFLRTLSGSVAQGKISVPSLHEGIQAFFDLNLANSIINHALGSRDLEPLNRGLTEAEAGVFGAAVNEYLPEYARAFENIFSDPAFSMVGSPDAKLDPAVSPSSTFVFFSAEAALGDNPPGKIVFGYPGNALKTLLAAYAGKKRDRELNFARLSPALLNKLRIAISATLGKTTLLASDLHRLEEGDVVSLDTPINAAIPLLIGNFIRSLGEPGILNKKRAARVAGFREEEAVEITPPLEIAAPPAVIEELPKIEPAQEAKEELPAEELAEEEFPEEDFDEEEFEEDFGEELKEEG